MSIDLLKNNIKRYVTLTPEQENIISNAVIYKTYKRGQFINMQGEVNRYTHFITKGSARVFYVDPEGQEHSIQLALKDWWTGDFTSFITRSPGDLFTEALEYTETIMFSYEQLQLLYEKVPPMERFYRLILQKAYAAFQQRVLQTLSMDAEHRYQAFRKAYPEMDRQIPQKHIASYLGVSAEFLSKIKKRIMLNEKAIRSIPTVHNYLYQ
ncbi:MAG TPA: Crp/Fnr family transcriptional regulator [Flavisolibacter sp.]|nr:Crp/Fnr family transcriptional regulator [Flavisolibacter sp.]